MSYLKTFQKFADRPLRPRPEEEEPPPPATLDGPSALEPDSAPTLDTVVAQAFPTTAPPLDLPDPLAGVDESNIFVDTFGSSDARKELALEVASNAGSEVLKGFETSLNVDVMPSDNVLRYVKGQEADEEVASLLTASPSAAGVPGSVEGCRRRP
jgi:hypothetical protein